MEPFPFSPSRSWLLKRGEHRQQTALDCWLVHYPSASPLCRARKLTLSDPPGLSRLGITAYSPQIAFSGDYFLVTCREAPSSYPSGISQTQAPSERTLQASNPSLYISTLISATTRSGIC